jgi:hypothetical protein
VQKNEISSEAATLNGRLAKLTGLQASAKQAISRGEHFPVYDETLKIHQAVADEIEALGVLAARIEIGFEKKIPLRNGRAGRRCDNHRHGQGHRQGAGPDYRRSSSFTRRCQ